MTIGVNDKSNIFYTIGPGRGSAVGSLVCYLIGITALDPIKYKLFFERYLNVERVSMPDIDADFANSIREDCIDYMRKRYGDEGVCGITTKSTVAARGAIDLAGRVNPALSGNFEKLDKIKKLIPKGPKVMLNGPYEDTEQTVKEFLLSQFNSKNLSSQAKTDAAEFADWK